jgi:hypothetical protein
MAQLVECLPSKLESLNSGLSFAKKERKKLKNSLKNLKYPGAKAGR